MTETNTPDPQAARPETKSCSRCGPKPRSAFGADRRRPDGLQSTCRECYAKQDRERRVSDPAYRERKVAESARQYWKDPAKHAAARKRTPSAQPEAKRAYNQAYWVANKDDLTALALQRYWEDPEAARSGAMGRYYDKLEENRARARRYAAEHRREALARTQAWMLANPDRVKASARLRVEREMAALVDVVTVLELGKRDHWICWICSKKVDPALDWRSDPMGGTKDHLIPITEDGLTEWRNLRLAHWACNRRRQKGHQMATPLLLLGDFGELAVPSPPPSEA